MCLHLLRGIVRSAVRLTVQRMRKVCSVCGKFRYTIERYYSRLFSASDGWIPAGDGIVRRVCPPHDA